MSLLRPPNIKTASLLRPVFPSPKRYFPYDILFDIKTNIKTASLLRPVFPSPKRYFPYEILFDIKTTSLIRPLLGSTKGGLNIGILLYFLQKNQPN